MEVVFLAKVNRPHFEMGSAFSTARFVMTRTGLDDELMRGDEMSGGADLCSGAAWGARGIRTVGAHRTRGHIA